VTAPVVFSPVDANGSKSTSRWTFAAPVRVDAVEPRAVLVVGGIANGTREFLPMLGLLSSQVALALQTTEATEARLRERTQRKFQSLVQNSSDLVTLVGPELTVLYQSPGVAAVLGYRPEDLVGRNLSEIVHPDDWATVRARLTMVIAGGTGTISTVESRVAHTGGHWRVVETVITNLLADPDVGAIVLNTRDITDRRALEDELSRQAFHDPLTDLANRALFHDRVAHALDRADRGADPIAVLFLDIDEFKMVNDSLGHPAGDQLLCAVADRIRESTRPSDTVARLGGDEFAVLVETGHMPGAAEAVANRIAEALVRTFRIGEDELTVRVSIGIAVGSRPESQPDDLMRDADLAMYMAKRNGKGRFEMFHPAMHEEAVRRLQLTAELRRGLERDELEVFYQPIIDVASGTAVGAEALVRWNHPDEGLIPPAEFIPIAESTGLIVPLGSWVLGEACRQTEQWRRSGIVDSSFYVSVNLSARQLQDPALITDVTAALSASGLPPAALVLEVTESTVMEDVGVTMPRLEALKGLGLRLAIDDFGTGYSSLSYLGNLPVEVVKIDKSFIDRITGAKDVEGAAMVRGVIELSHALGLTSVAEGVELSDQLDVLTELGCDNVQGYLFARPVPASEMVLTLERLRAAHELSLL
jgi:diguanylate cyclase (GGDEF)-like protein/PAS domain S-box-containing protein